MTDRALEIRQFEMDDAKRLWRIHEEALRASELDFREDMADEDFTRIPEWYLETGGEFLLGMVQDEIVAMGGYRPESQDTVEIRRMRVHPDYQGRGYGKRMLWELESRASDAGYQRFTLYTNSKLVAARGLYREAGYEVTGHEIHEGSGETFIHYQKAVKQADTAPDEGE